MPRRTRTRKKQSLLMRILAFIPSVLLVAIFVYGGKRLVSMIQKPQTHTVSAAELLSVINTDELSTAEYIYNGIAEVYNESKPEEIDYYASYHSRVKVGVNAELIKIESIDNENKEITILLPPVGVVGEPIIDEKALSCMRPGVITSFSPSDQDIFKAIRRCKEDAAEEASNTPELYTTAIENLHATIEALLTPLIGSDYVYNWEVRSP